MSKNKSALGLEQERWWIAFAAAPKAMAYPAVLVLLSMDIGLKEKVLT